MSAELTGPDGSSVGGSAGPPMPALSSTHWNRLCTSADPFRAAGSSTTATGAPTTSRSATPSAAPRRASSPRLAASAAATTTPWPRRSAASTRPSLSGAGDPGARWRRSSSPPWTGWMGSTTAACSSPSATSLHEISLRQTRRGSFYGCKFEQQRHQVTFLNQQCRLSWAEPAPLALAFFWPIVELLIDPQRKHSDFARYRFGTRRAA